VCRQRKRITSVDDPDESLIMLSADICKAAAKVRIVRILWKNTRSQLQKDAP
jgi:hypothetical protein